MSERYRYFRLFLYADNPSHMKSLKKIQRDYSLFSASVGIWHTLKENGSEIVSGSGKKHCHIILAFKNARSYSNICNIIFGSDDSRFIGRIGYDEKTGKRVKYDTLENAFVYLPHLNAPDKEQYEISDLFGCPAMVRRAAEACTDYLSRSVTVRQALDAVSLWVISQYGKIITPFAFLFWIKSTPFVKYRNDGLIWRLIQQHNDAVWHDLQEDSVEAAEEWQAKQDRDAVLRVQSEEFGFETLLP